MLYPHQSFLPTVRIFIWIWGLWSTIIVRCTPRRSTRRSTTTPTMSSPSWRRCRRWWWRTMVWTIFGWSLIWTTLRRTMIRINSFQQHVLHSGHLNRQFPNLIFHTIHCHCWYSRHTLTHPAWWRCLMHRSTSCWQSWLDTLVGLHWGFRAMMARGFWV